MNYVLVVDDNEQNRKFAVSVAGILFGKDAEIVEAFDGLNALENLRSHSPLLVLTDLQMPRMNGDSLVLRLHEIDSDMRIIIMSGDATRIDNSAADKVAAIVHKPCTAHDLVAVIASVMAR